MPPDLYTELLDIPEGTRPPDCYTLLGLPLYENAPEAIRKAVLAQTAKVRRHALDPDRERAQRIQEILNEIGRARTILGDPQRKSRHDDLMIARQFGFEVPPESSGTDDARRHKLCPDCGARMVRAKKMCARCGWSGEEQDGKSADETVSAETANTGLGGAARRSQLKAAFARAVQILERCGRRLRMPVANAIVLRRVGIAVAAFVLLVGGTAVLMKIDALDSRNRSKEQVHRKTTRQADPTPETLFDMGTVIGWADVHPAFRNRAPGERAASLAKHGGTEATEAGVMNALRWLRAQQGEDGAWGNEFKPAVTAFALLAFLGHGETLGSPDFGEAVARALGWFVKNQEANGFFKGGDGHQYSSVVAAYALAEACVLMDLPTVEPVLTKVLDVIIKGQNPKGLWNYECVPGDRNDTCYSVWCAQALATARMAGLGNERIEAAMRRAVPGFKANAHSDGGFGYCAPGTKYAAVGAWSLQILGVPNDPDVRKALGVAGRETFAWRRGEGSREHPLYHAYFTTCALAARNDDRWKKWNGQISKSLCANQTKRSSPQPAALGHWVSPCPKEAQRPHAYTTALCTLMLESYYRYIPEAFPSLPAAKPRAGARPAQRTPTKPGTTPAKPSPAPPPRKVEHATAPPRADCLVWEDFQDVPNRRLPAGWEHRFSGDGKCPQGAIDDPKESGNKIFQLKGKHNWASYVYRAFRSPPSRIAVECRISAEGDNGGIVFWNHGENTWGRGYARVWLDDGQMHFSVGNENKAVGQYKPNRWYCVKAFFDAEANTLIGWLDGKKVADLQGKTRGRKGWCDLAFAADHDAHRIRFDDVRAWIPSEPDKPRDSPLHKPGEKLMVDLGGGVTMEFAWCPRGTFTMGCTTRGVPGWIQRDEKQHRVTVTKGFWMGRYEVTQEQWSQLMGTNDSASKWKRKPVENVNWTECQEYIKKLNRLDGDGAFRLPTEAEWEYACRAGTKTGFNNGKEVTTMRRGVCRNLNEVGWYEGNAEKAVHSVGQKKANAWGLYDMHGNVLEWCHGFARTYPDNRSIDPTQPPSLPFHVLRGGSWRAYPDGCRSGCRRWDRPTTKDDSIGFRIVLVRR